MVAEAVLQRLCAEFDSPPDRIRTIVELLESGGSPEFLLRYRRDETGDAGDDRVRAIAERFQFLAEQEARKEPLIAKATARGDDVERLRAMLADCYDQELLDDLDHALRPHEHQEAGKIIARGLGDLVESVHRHELGENTPHEAAAPFVDPEKGLASADDVLAAVVLALAERYGEDPEFRAIVRDELGRGILRATAAAPGASQGGKRIQKRYEEFFDFQEPVRQIAAQRMLALRKAEREGLIRARLVLAPSRELELFRRRFSPDVDPATPLGQFLDLVYGHSYDHFVHPACEKQARHAIKEKADRETVRSFARTLRAQLMAPTVRSGAVMALRASAKSVWIVVLGEDGSVKQRHTFPIPDGDARAELIKAVVEVVTAEKPRFIGIPHGRREEQASRVVESVIEAIPAPERPGVVPIDETASVVLATSVGGRRRQPGTETGMRATHSLARRLRDPMLELLRVEPRGLGLGHNLTEVHQGLLNRQLESVLSSCLALVGVDVNRADAAFLARVPGLARETAKAIVDHRSKNGPFGSLEDIHNLEAIDDATFRNVAGFLRLFGGSEPLDATPVHPEDYELARQVATRKGTDVPSLFGHTHKDVPLNDLLSDTVGRKHALGLLHALSNGDRDPRGEHGTFENSGIKTIDDLKTDVRLRGRVTNLTEFGAFIDIGIGQDGLVHISQIPGSRLRDPDQTLRVGEIISVFVVHLDAAKKKISLSMMKPRHLAEGRQATVGERMQGGRSHQRRRPPREEVQNRAAREPEGRRGGQRRGPRPKFKERDRGDRMDRGGPRGGRGDRGGSGRPRVITVEPDQPLEESRGVKGEFRSLSGLKALLGGGADKPKEPEATKQATRSDDAATATPAAATPPPQAPDPAPSHSDASPAETKPDPAPSHSDASPAETKPDPAPSHSDASPAETKPDPAPSHSDASPAETKPDAAPSHSDASPAETKPDAATVPDAVDDGAGAQPAGDEPRDDASS